jgi:hypothetical protein
VAHNTTESKISRNENSDMLQSDDAVRPSTYKKMPSGYGLNVELFKYTLKERNRDDKP